MTLMAKKNNLQKILFSWTENLVTTSLCTLWTLASEKCLIIKPLTFKFTHLPEINEVSCIVKCGMSSCIIETEVDQPNVISTHFICSYLLFTSFFGCKLFAKTNKTYMQKITQKIRSWSCVPFFLFRAKPKIHIWKYFVIFLPTMSSINNPHGSS